jgi:hypothetical protein
MGSHAQLHLQATTHRTSNRLHNRTPRNNNTQKKNENYWILPKAKLTLIKGTPPIRTTILGGKHTVTTTKKGAHQKQEGEKENNLQ